MLYTSNKELPNSIKKLPYKAQTKFRESYNNKSSLGDSTAFRIAWDSLKPYFQKKEDKWVAKGLTDNTYTFNIDIKENLFVQKAEDGNYYIEGVLSDIFPDSDGWTFTEEILQDFADQINNSPIFGGITHEEWKELKMKYSHLPENEFIEKARSERKGILKTVKAIYEKGKLWIKAIIDKRYLNHITKFNKMSLEAIVPSKYKINGKYTKGKILGFALDNNAINQRTSVKIK